MSNKIKVLSISIISLILVTIIITLGLSYWAASSIVNRPVTDRYDFCSGNAIFCTKKLLTDFSLNDVKVDVELTSFDGTILRGLYFPSRNGAAVIVQHGYADHSGAVLHIANMLYQQGFGVITMDLRAHGKSEGELVTFGRDESRDMSYAVDYLAQREEVDPGKIGAYGWSLGAATVLLQGAANENIKAVVADSPFDAINDENLQEFTDTIWPLPSLIGFFSSLISGVDFEKESPIANLSVYQNKPLFILIAGSDTIVDPRSGERLVSELGQSKVQVWREPSFDHVRFSFDAPDRFSKDVGQFFRTHLKPAF